MAAEQMCQDEYAGLVLIRLTRYLQYEPKRVVVDATAPGIHMSVVDQVGMRLTVFHCAIEGDGHKYPAIIDCQRHGANWVDVCSPIFNSEFDGRSPFNVLDLLRDVPPPVMFQVLVQRILADLRMVFFLSMTHARGALQAPVNDVVWPWQ